MGRLLFIILLFCGSLLSASAQQVNEKLNRAPVAVKASNGILVSWRSLKEDAADLSFDIYRNGEKIASSLTAKTNYLDADGKADDKYSIVASNGEGFETVAWNNMFAKLKVSRPAPTNNAVGASGYYYPDDMSTGDLDGDGDYELILKWMPDNQQDNGYDGYTSPCIIDAYEMDGTQLWRINLGLNIRSGNHYTQFLVYDFDGDGKAEMICKTAPGSLDGKGNYVSEAGNAAIKGIDNSKTYVNTKGRIAGGEEFLTVFNGETGAAMSTIWYSPNRKGTDFPTAADTYDSNVWGDSNYNRGNRHNAAVAYLDGLDKLPSAIMQRGYYTRCYIWAVDWDGKSLKTKWLHRGTSKTAWSAVDASGKVKYNGASVSSYGQGVHGISVGDVDLDGFDEICIGSATIDHDGSLLCSTGLGHGDAIHLSDLCPDRPGLEVMMPHEDKPYGYDVHDAATGELIVSNTGSSDNSRGLACDFITTSNGSEFWSSADGNTYRCADGSVALGSKADTNFRIYWTGDPFDQTFDGSYDKNSQQCFPRIRSYNSATKKIMEFQSFSATGSPQTCNTTKATPCLQADLLGDWREEVVMYQYNNDITSSEFTLMIFSTPEPTTYKVPCLMQDHVYRMGVAWQNSSYNQPPHLGYNLANSLGVNRSTYKTQTVSHAPAYYDDGEGDDPDAEHTEVVGHPSTDAAAFSGICYNAGNDGEFTNSTTGGYTKVRTNRGNTSITFNANEGYVLTGIAIEARSNNTSTTADRSIFMTGVFIDNSSGSLIEDDVMFPGGTAGSTYKKVEYKGFEAKESIKLTFDNSLITTSEIDKNGKNAQLYAKFTLTYKKAASPSGIVENATRRTANGAIFNLAGQRVGKASHGIFIINGKKFIK